jgi:hypothetical protein
MYFSAYISGAYLSGAYFLLHIFQFASRPGPLIMFVMRGYISGSYTATTTTLLELYTLSTALYCNPNRTRDVLLRTFPFLVINFLSWCSAELCLCVALVCTSSWQGFKTRKKRHNWASDRTVEGFTGVGRITISCLDLKSCRGRGGASGGIRGEVSLASCGQRLISSKSTVKYKSKESKPITKAERGSVPKRV